MTTANHLDIGSIMETLFSSGVKSTLTKYPELEPLRLTFVKILWLERRLAAAEAVTVGLTRELLTLERKLCISISDEVMVHPRSGLTLPQSEFPLSPWTNLSFAWAYSAAYTAIRRTYRSIISAFSWRLAVVGNAVIEILKRN